MIINNICIKIKKINLNAMVGKFAINYINYIQLYFTKKINK